MGDDWYAEANRLIRWMRKRGVLALSMGEKGPVPGLVAVNLGPPPARKTIASGSPMMRPDPDKALEEYKKRIQLAAAGGFREEKPSGGRS